MDALFSCKLCDPSLKAITHETAGHHKRITRAFLPEISKSFRAVKADNDWSHSRFTPRQRGGQSKSYASPALCFPLFGFTYTNTRQMHSDMGSTRHSLHSVCVCVCVCTCVRARVRLRTYVCGRGGGGGGVRGSEREFVTDCLSSKPHESVSQGMQQLKHVLPHRDRSCGSNFRSHLVTVYLHRVNRSYH